MFFVSLYINISNILTCFRLFSSIPVSWLIFHEHFLWTLSLIFLAGISDTFDGFLARRFDQCTVLGSYLDPVADKVLIFCVYVALAMKGALPVWLMFLVIGRDVLIVSVFLFSLAMKWNLNFNPLWIGKVSTFFQFLLPPAVLFNLSGVCNLGILTRLLLIIVTALTLLSSIAYFFGWCRDIWCPHRSREAQ